MCVCTWNHGFCIRKGNSSLHGLFLINCSPCHKQKQNSVNFSPLSWVSIRLLWKLDVRLLIRNSLSIDKRVINIDTRAKDWRRALECLSRMVQCSWVTSLNNFPQFQKKKLCCPYVCLRGCCVIAAAAVIFSVLKKSYFRGLIIVAARFPCDLFVFNSNSLFAIFRMPQPRVRPTRVLSTRWVTQRRSSVRLKCGD